MKLCQKPTRILRIELWHLKNTRIKDMQQIWSWIQTSLCRLHFWICGHPGNWSSAGEGQDERIYLRDWDEETCRKCISLLKKLETRLTSKMLILSITVFQLCWARKYTEIVHTQFYPHSINSHYTPTIIPSYHQTSQE